MLRRPLPLILAREFAANVATLFPRHRHRRGAHRLQRARRADHRHHAGRAGRDVRRVAHRAGFEVEPLDVSPGPDPPTPLANRPPRGPAGARRAGLHRADGRRTTLSVTAVPLLGHGDHLAGVFLLIWQLTSVGDRLGRRGSLAAPGPETVDYGGNTTVPRARAADEHPLPRRRDWHPRSGHELARPYAPDQPFLLTHLHLDHIEGLGLFAPLWLPARSCTSGARPRRSRASPNGSPATSPRRCSRYSLASAAPVVCHDLRPRVPPGARRRPRPSGHPLRPDGRLPVRRRPAPRSPTSPTMSPSSASSPARPAGLAFGLLARHGVETLVNDAQYFETEYCDRRGFGHSSVAHAVAFAPLPHAGRLVLSTMTRSTPTPTSTARERARGSSGARRHPRARPRRDAPRPRPPPASW